jgi:hypothetical protein
MKVIGQKKEYLLHGHWNEKNPGLVANRKMHLSSANTLPIPIQVICFTRRTSLLYPTVELSRFHPF